MSRDNGLISPDLLQLYVYCRFVQHIDSEQPASNGKKDFLIAVQR